MPKNIEIYDELLQDKQDKRIIASLTVGLKTMPTISLLTGPNDNMMMVTPAQIANDIGPGPKAAWQLLQWD